MNEQINTARRSEIIYAALVLFAVVLLPLLLWYSPQLTDFRHNPNPRTFIVVAHGHEAVQENIPESGYWAVSEGSAWKFWEAGTPSKAVGKNEIRVKKGEIVRLKITSFDNVHGFMLPGYGIDERVYPGKVTVVTFKADKAGEYPFFCSRSCGFPAHMHMNGKLVVE